MIRRLWSEIRHLVPLQQWQNPSDAAYCGGRTQPAINTSSFPECGWFYLQVKRMFRSQMEEEVVWLSELCLLIKGLTNMVVRAP